MCLIFVVFAYTTVVNIIERPEGLQIAAWFIVAIVGASLVSRVMRSTELRIEGIECDALAEELVNEAARRTVAANHCQSAQRGLTTPNTRTNWTRR